MALALAVSAAEAQSLISEGNWQGFTSLSPDGRFAQCALYNRAVERLNENPYEMLGVTRSAAGEVGLLVFFRPGAFQRGAGLAVTLKLDDRPAATLTGDAISDFHVRIAGPLPATLLARLREARKFEASVQGQTVGFALDGIDAVLDGLSRCVAARKQ